MRLLIVSSYTVITTQKVHGMPVQSSFIQWTGVPLCKVLCQWSDGVQAAAGASGVPVPVRRIVFPSVPVSMRSLRDCSSV